MDMYQYNVIQVHLMKKFIECLEASGVMKQEALNIWITKHAAQFRQDYETIYNNCKKRR